MPKVTIKDLPYKQATPHVNWLTSYAFTATPPVREDEILLDVLKQTDKTTRNMVLFEDDQAVACAGSGGMMQNVRGKLMPMSGVFRVATHPAARRKGYSYQVIAALLKTDRENGQPLTCLYPFRESFYERLGYVSFPVGVKAKINIRGLLPLVKQGYGENTELIEFISDPDRYFQFIEEQKLRTHGMASFISEIKPDPARHKLWLAFAHVDGKVEGLLAYTLSGESPTKFKFNASRLYYSSAAARYELLGWIGRHLDQTEEVTIHLPVYEKPNTWFSDLDLEIDTNWIAPMCRVLDVTGIDGIPCGPGAFTAQIVDTTCPWNEGIWRFESQEGALKVSPADKADFTLAIQGLSAWLYGTNPPEEFKFRGWGDPGAEAQQVLLEMLPVAEAHIHAYF